MKKVKINLLAADNGTLYYFDERLNCIGAQL